MKYYYDFTADICIEADTIINQSRWYTHGEGYRLSMHPPDFFASWAADNERMGSNSLWRITRRQFRHYKKFGTIHC